VPNIDPAMFKAVLDAGGWVACAITLGVVIGLIVRGDLVPGALYRREVDRADTATNQLERQNDLGETLTTQVETLIRLVADVLSVRTGR
jgi:hypothetical protein